MATGGLATLLGWKHLLVRPGVYSVILWWGYVVMALTVAFLWGNETGRILRLAIPLLLVGFGLNATLIVAACGMRAGEAVRWFLGAAMTNVLWRFVFGATMTNTPLSEIRMEILSPAIGFLFAWTGCAFLLRHRFTWWSLVILGVPLAVAAISVTRSLALPFVVSFLTASFCLALAMLWKMYDLRFPFRKVDRSWRWGWRWCLSSSVSPWCSRISRSAGINGCSTTAAKAGRRPKTSPR